MRRWFTTAVTLLLVASSALFAHDSRLHGANANTGEVVAITKDGFDLKTKNETIHVKYSDATKFELDGKASTSKAVQKGQRIGVVGAKASGDVTAEQVIILPATNAGEAAKK